MYFVGKRYSQHITNDAHGPHVSSETDLIEVDDLGGHELWSSEEHL